MGLTGFLVPRKAGDKYKREIQATTSDLFAITEFFTSRQVAGTGTAQWFRQSLSYGLSGSFAGSGDAADNVDRPERTDWGFSWPDQDPDSYLYWGPRKQLCRASGHGWEDGHGRR